MQDNTLVHKGKIAMECFRQQGVLLMDWPPSSPDLNSIEHVWVIIKGRIFCRPQRPSTAAQMRQAVDEEWERLDQEQIAGIISSMPARIQAVIDANGGPT